MPSQTALYELVPALVRCGALTGRSDVSDRVFVAFMQYILLGWIWGFGMSGLVGYRLSWIRRTEYGVQSTVAYGRGAIVERANVLVVKNVHWQRGACKVSAL